MRRDKPYSLRWPLTGQQVEQIDDMLQSLFDDSGNGAIDVSIDQITDGVLTVPFGGTGLGSYTLGDLLVADTTSSFTRLHDVAVGNVLRSAGVGAAPSYGQVVLTTDVTGILPVTNGGTGFASYTVGDLLYADGAASLAKLIDVTVGSYLRSGGAALAPLWSTLVLPNAATTGDVFMATSTNTMGRLADVAAGSYLRAGGVSTAPLWSTVVIPNAATIGDLWQATATSTITALASVSANSYLRSAGVGTANVWSTVKIPNAATTGDLWQGTATSTISALTGVAAGSYLRSGGVATANVWSTVTLPNTAVTGDLWYASATSIMTALADVAAGSYLRSGGVTTAPLWSTLQMPDSAAQGDVFISTTLNVMTTLAKNTTATRYLSNTGASNNPAWAQINIPDGLTIASQATGDILYASSATVWARLAIGTSVQVLHGGTTPSYSAISLTADVSGVLPIANGGTNSSTALSGSSIMISDGSKIIQGAAGTTTTLLHGNAGGAPTYAAVSLTADVSGDLPFANLVQASAISVLVGRGAAAGAGDFQEITLGTGLSMTGTVLSATGAGSGTVTNTGTLTANALMLGNGGVDITALGSLGSATTVLHGGAGAPSFAAVSLTADVTGTLPIANGGTGQTTAGPAQGALNAEFTTTTTGNIDDLNFSNASIIRMNNATLSTIRGLLAGTAGQRVTIVSIGAGQVDLSHQDTNDATAANRLLNMATGSKSSLAAGIGSATYQYDSTTARWRLVLFNQGDWITPAYSAGDFTAIGAMTWTVEAGDVTSYTYWLKDRILTVNWFLETTSVGGTLNDRFYLKVPGGFTVAKSTLGPIISSNAGAGNVVGFCQALVSTTVIEILRLPVANWSAATDSTTTFGTVLFSVT